MAFIPIRKPWTKQPQRPLPVSPQLQADFVWNAAANDYRVVLASGAITGTPGGRALSGGYARVSGVPASATATTWTEFGCVILDGTPLLTLSGRFDGQAVYFSSAANTVSMVMWGVADVPITVPSGTLSGIVHYVARRVGSEHKLWLNGRLMGTASNASSPAAVGGYTYAVGAEAGSGSQDGVNAVSATSGVLFVCRTPLALPEGVCAALSGNSWAVFPPMTTLLPVASATVQYAHPTTDTTAGAWTPSTGVDLFACIDESTASDTDYISTTSASTCKFKIGTLTDPAVSTGHILDYRIQVTTGTLYARLREGTTLIAERTHTTADAASLTTFNYTLSAGEANSITDYTNLYIEFESA